MLVFLNGKFVPEEKAVVSVFDRGFLYGDGLFEAIRIFNGKPFRWPQHLERLKRGADFLKVKLPFSENSLRGFAEKLVKKNKMSDSILRLTLSRGVGARGYSPKNAEQPTLVMSLHPVPGAPGAGSLRRRKISNRADSVLGAPPRWKLIASLLRLPANDPFAPFKTCNKLPQILARAEADAAGADEALLLNADGFVTEAASGNLFWIEQNEIYTPPIASGILPGVTRATVFEIGSKLKISVLEKSVRLENLARANGIFLSLTSLGIVEVESLDGKILNRSPLTAQIARAYNEILKSFSSSPS
ncbi:MAG: aminotransferase class IV [Limisphaerales bacterium]